MVFCRRRPLVETGTPLADIAEGEIVRINESGSPVEFYVAKQNYESGLNGTGRVLVVRKDCFDSRAWNDSGFNTWASCSLYNWLNAAYKNLLDANIQEIIESTAYYYTIGQGNTTVVTHSSSVFSLSATELGQSISWFNVEGSALPIASILQVAYRNGAATSQWTRSPVTMDGASAVMIYPNGGAGSQDCAYGNDSRPCFTFPSDITVGDNNLIA